MLRVAVTGVGGGVGQSIMKALSVCAVPVEIHAVDITPLSAGLYRGANCQVLSPPEAPGAIHEWKRWILEEHIDAVIPGSDHDLLPLADVRDDWQAEGVCRVLISDADLVRVCRDKAVTCQRLAAAGLPHPASICDLPEADMLAWAQAQGFPVVIKPRDGFASRHVNVVRDAEEFSFYIRRTPNPLVQEYLHADGKTDEYTCAVFVDSAGEPVGTFMARRDLSAGATYRAEIGKWPELERLLTDIGRALRPRGPLNVQLRMTDRGPVPFELNIRCSGTAAMRAHYGYNEPEMLLRHFVLGEALEPPLTRTGFVFRYWNEMFLNDVSREQLMNEPRSIKGEIRAWP